MGKAYTVEGITLNLGGTTAPTTARGLQFGENKEAFVEWGTGGGGTIVIESLDKKIALNIDSGTLIIAASSAGVIHINGGANTMVRLTGASGGTKAELSGAGNLRLAGTLGTGISF